MGVMASWVRTAGRGSQTPKEAAKDPRAVPSAILRRPGVRPYRT